MKKESIIKYPFVLITTCLVATIILMVYAAHPWGDSYAYEDLMGYFGLLLFIAWAISPYLLLLFFFRKSPANRSTIISRAIGTSLICLPTLVIIIDAGFIHLDAQGGLVFIFLPFYQWIAVAVFWVVNLLVVKRKIDRQENPFPGRITKQGFHPYRQNSKETF